LEILLSWKGKCFILIRIDYLPFEDCYNANQETIPCRVGLGQGFPKGALCFESIFTKFTESVLMTVTKHLRRST
jgi:hypothetical protein